MAKNAKSEPRVRGLRLTRNGFRGMMRARPPEEEENLMNNKKAWVLLTVVFLLAATASWAAQTAPQTKAPAKAAPAAKEKAAAGEKPKEHQATGTVVSLSSTSLVISKAVGKKKSEWTFVITPQTKTQGSVAKDARVTVYYHEEKDQKIAHRVKVWAAKASEKKPATGAAKRTKS